MSPYLLSKEVAERFRVDPSTVRRWLKSGRISGHRYGRDWRIPSSEVARMEAEARGEAA
ncbi:DNA-binding protein [Nonomuraea deserti]|uniref:DNA-binding protein n=1 Tax=Nonomuraea deserti TaxID=1848322 RepID=A0A4R4VFP7_9ACTN|nr:helix-turn-helix domain-containing protein [Nonomuraea deserti]TDC98509.1 DNA-binding protein [Nonomuraea deserti]